LLSTPAHDKGATLPHVALGANPWQVWPRQSNQLRLPNVVGGPQRAGASRTTSMGQPRGYCAAWSQPATPPCLGTCSWARVGAQSTRSPAQRTVSNAAGGCGNFQYNKLASLGDGCFSRATQQAMVRPSIEKGIEDGWSCIGHWTHSSASSGLKDGVKWHWPLDSAMSWGSVWNSKCEGKVSPEQLRF